MTCNAPNPGTEMRCQREANHSGECWSKYKIFYEHGIISWGEMTWVGPNNLPKKETEDGKAVVLLALIQPLFALGFGALIHWLGR